MESIRINAKKGFAVVSAGAKQNNVSVATSHHVTTYKGVSVDPSRAGNGYVDLTPEAALKLANAILAGVAESLPHGWFVVRDLGKKGEPFQLRHIELGDRN